MLTGGLGFNIYVISYLYININRFVNLHNPLNLNIIPTFYHSINQGLLNLDIINFVCLLIIIGLIIMLFYRFNYNKNVKNIYFLILLTLLLIGLINSTFTIDELYANLDSYVNIYINEREK